MLRSFASPSLLIAVTVGAMSFAAPLPALAAEAPPTDPTARAEWLSGQAETAFAEKRFADAIRLYLDAWEAAPAASILYNVAFIYDKRLNDPELAIDYYERAAASSDADAELKAKATARVAQLRGELAKPPDKPPEKPPTKPPATGGSTVAPWIVTASGGALLIGGVIMGVVAKGTESDFSVATSAAEKRELQDSGKSQALVADLLMGTGIIALGTGIVWLIIESGSSSGGASVEPVPETGFRFEPRVIPGGAALVFGGHL